MNKRELTNVARVIKQIDVALWGVPKDVGDKLREARLPLIRLIFAEGYELSTTYRVVKPTTPRST